MTPHEADHQRSIEDLHWEDIDRRVKIGEIALQEGLVEYYAWFQSHHYWEGEQLIIDVREASGMPEASK